MTNIAEIKQVMQSDKKKVNNICIYELEANISRAHTRARNCSRTSSRKSMNTYGAAAEALVLGSTALPAMSSKRLSTSGKKSSSGKWSSVSGVSVMNRSVVAQSAPQKPYHPSPVQDSKRRGFGGLLSRPAVHAASRDGEEPYNSAVRWNSVAEEALCCVSLERSDLSFIGTGEGGERATTEGETKRRRRSE